MEGTQRDVKGHGDAGPGTEFHRQREMKMAEVPPTL